MLTELNKITFMVTGLCVLRGMIEVEYQRHSYALETREIKFFLRATKKHTMAERTNRSGQIYAGV